MSVTSPSLSRTAWVFIVAGIMAPWAGAQGDARPRIEDLLWDSRPEYTRFIFQISAPAESIVYQHHPFENDPRLFYIDIYGMRPTYSGQTIPMGRDGQGDGLLRRVQIVNYPDSNAIRFIFELEHPDRLNSVVVHPLGHSLQVDMTRRRTPGEATVAEVRPETLARAGAGSARRPVVIIDPGHGGQSTGTRSRIRVGGEYLDEKDVVLEISRRLARRLQETGLVEVRLTRTDDRVVSLDERVAMARAWQGDMFVSIHANDAGNPRRYDQAQGLEIFYLSETGERRHTENLLESLNGERRRQERQILRVVQVQSSRVRFESYRLALHIAAAFVRERHWRPTSHGGDGHFRNIRPRNFHVLRNFDMPCVLVETGFLTHPVEARLLVDPVFQQTIANLIADGVIAHCQGRESQEVGG